MTWWVAYIGTIFAANWPVSAFGAVPVGFGLTAPAGVYFAGLAFTFRDFVQEQLGAALDDRGHCGGRLAVGGGLAAVCARQRGGVSSVGLVDFAVYTPLRERPWVLAVALSNVAGLVVDSALFPWLAFGSLTFLWEHVIGKAWMTVLALAILSLWRGREVFLRHP